MRQIVTLFCGGYLGGFVIKFREMDDVPFYKRPWAYIAGWLAILLVVYGWQIYRMGGIRANLVEIFVDLACVFPLLCTIRPPGPHLSRPPKNLRPVDYLPLRGARTGSVH